MVSELKQMMATDLASRVDEGADYLVVECAKLEGVEATELRKKMRESQVRLEVVKNSIAKRVLESRGLGAGMGLLSGPSAIVTGACEMPVVCKLAKDLAKEYDEKFIIRGGMFEGNLLDVAGVNRLAEIPPMPVLQSQIIGGVYATMAGVGNAFQCISRSLACALEGIREKKEQEG
jgi:large subunit ribosomal protein L10